MTRIIQRGCEAIGIKLLDHAARELGLNPDKPGKTHIAWWLQGDMISVSLTLPVILIISKQDMKAVSIILTMAAIFGALMGQRQSEKFH